MKLAICSDLHLEFQTITLHNEEDADVLILSGDICVASKLAPYHNPYSTASTHSDLYHDFFRDVSKKFKNVIYVAGNHEHYQGDFAITYSTLKDQLSYLPNIHVLDKENVTIDDVTFIGGTLWTDFNNEDPVTMFSIRNMMNDFIQVRNSNRVSSFKDMDGNFRSRTPTFTPDDALEDHQAMLGHVIRTVDADPEMKFVVVSHHAPSRQSTHPRYANDELMNGGYSSRLDFIIEDRPQIKLCTHGHTHEPFDYNIGLTRIVCNPRGYKGHEKRADDFELKYVTI